MRNFLLNYCPYLIFLIVICEAILLYCFIKDYQSNKKEMSFYLILLTAGLLYDASILALGFFLKEGTILKTLSYFRYIFHSLLIPLLLLICGEALNLDSNKKKLIRIITFILMLIGLIASLIMKIEPSYFAGITRYVSSDTNPKWAEKFRSVSNVALIIPVIVIGLMKKKYYFFLAGFLMFFFSALAPITGNFDLIFFISMIGELLMILFFYLHLKKNN